MYPKILDFREKDYKGKHENKDICHYYYCNHNLSIEGFLAPE